MPQPDRSAGAAADGEVFSSAPSTSRRSGSAAAELAAAVHQETMGAQPYSGAFVFQGPAEAAEGGGEEALGEAGAAEDEGYGSVGEDGSPARAVAAEALGKELGEAAMEVEQQPHQAPQQEVEEEAEGQPAQLHQLQEQEEHGVEDPDIGPPSLPAPHAAVEPGPSAAAAAPAPSPASAASPTCEVPQGTSAAAQPEQLPAMVPAAAAATKPPVPAPAAEAQQRAVQQEQQEEARGSAKGTAAEEPQLRQFSPPEVAGPAAAAAAALPFPAPMPQPWQQCLSPPQAQLVLQLQGVAGQHPGMQQYQHPGMQQYLPQGMQHQLLLAMQQQHEIVEQARCEGQQHRHSCCIGLLGQTWCLKQQCACTEVPRPTRSNAGLTVPADHSAARKLAHRGALLLRPHLAPSSCPLLLPSPCPPCLRSSRPFKLPTVWEELRVWPTLLAVDAPQPALVMGVTAVESHSGWADLTLR